MRDGLQALVITNDISPDEVPHPATIREIERRRDRQYEPEQPSLPLERPMPQYAPRTNNPEDEAPKRGVVVIPMYGE